MVALNLLGGRMKKEYTIVDSKILIDFRGGLSTDWQATKAYVKDTVKATYNFNTKTWLVERSIKTIELLEAHGFIDSTTKPIKTRSNDDLYAPKQFPELSTIKLNEKLLPDTIRDYQREAIQHIMALKDRAIIGLPPGAGKSLISAVYMAHYNNDKPWLFVVPASIKVTLAKEIQKWTRMKTLVAFSTFKMATVKKNIEVIVVNYDILHKLVPEFKGKIAGIICDECHYLANIESKRTKAARDIIKTAPKVVLMSGTLLKNKPSELWPLLDMVDPAEWSNRSGYLSRYCKPSVGFGGRIVYDGATNLDELHQRTKPYIYYKSMEEILPQLPTVLDMFYEVDVADKEFNKANQEILEALESGNYDRAELLEKMAELSRSAFFHKRDTFYEMVDEYLASSDEKIVLVGVHKTVIADMVAKYDCEFISGSVPSHNRNAIIERFHSSDKKVLVLQLEAAGTGFSILCSQVMFFGETNYSFSAYQQVKARIRRMNTVAEHCRYYHFVCADSVEERMMKLMSKKENISAKVIEGRESTTLADAKYEIIMAE
jgi:SWI/SNF-related matrix-associated actin-dependent regulator of chromatin subfamily A-like protein 1